MKALVTIAIALAIPSISLAQGPRCEMATVDKQTCRVKPTATHDYLITAKASANAGEGHGNPQIKVHITVDGDECTEKETDAWQNGPASLEATCQTTLTPGQDHEIKGSAINRDAKSTGFGLTVQEQ